MVKVVKAKSFELAVRGVTYEYIVAEKKGYIASK
jgi:hypothetical protein